MTDSGRGVVNTLLWQDNALHLIDQRKLPLSFETVVCHTAEETAAAITNMVVRGAPAIGAAAAYGMALGASDLAAEFGGGTASEGQAGAQLATFTQRMEQIGEHMRAARPTAVNLGWAVDRMLDVMRAEAGQMSARSTPEGPTGSAVVKRIAERLLVEAHQIADEDRRICRDIGKHGTPLIEAGGVMHHCNTGALATVDYGTALGVIRAAHEAGTDIHVYPTETRPFMQGARLTTWELLQEGIPTTLITDSMAAHVMAQRLVKSVIVGADRITANGDVINKIGTYGLAVLAKEHGIPFYVAAPISTLDLTLKTGADVVIEERDETEVTHILGHRVAPEGIGVFNPAFDVTPARYVTAIITEHGVVRAPYEQGLKKVAAMSDNGAGSGTSGKEANSA